MKILTTTLKVTVAMSFLALTLGSPQSPPTVKPPIEASLIRLIAAPRDLNGTLVLTSGYLNMEFEGDALYVSENDFRNNLYENAVTVDSSAEMRKQLQKVSGMYVVVVGFYRAKPDVPTAGASAGHLTDIQRVVAISDPASPSRKQRSGGN